MRSIPFKVVYVLGMNDSDYPRTSQKSGFDIMEFQRRLCDRSRRYEDRYIFLETILSARQNLILSYQGQSLKDNAEIPPSVLVCELCDYLGRACAGEEAVLERIVTRHPLQPFSHKYFRGDEKLFSYSAENQLAAAGAAETGPKPHVFFPRPLPPPGGDWKSISLDQLCRFFDNPSEFLLRNRLCAPLRLEEAGKPEEREPFSLDPLQQYKLRQELLEKRFSGHSLDQCFDTAAAAGILPHGSTGAAEYHRQQREAEAFAEAVQKHTAGHPPARLDICLSLDAARTTLTGSLESLYPAGQLFFRCANIKTRDRLRAWLHHLVLNAAEQPVPGRRTLLLGRDGTSACGEMDRQKALGLLAALAGLFSEGLRAPLCFFPDASLAYAEASIKDLTDGDALARARKKWDPDYYGNGECNDIYFKTCFGRDMPATEVFRETAAAVFGPLLKNGEA